MILQKPCPLGQGSSPETLPPFLKYAVDRLFHAYRFYDKDNWELQIDFGYYGAEKVLTFFTKMDDVKSHLYALKSITNDIDIIKYLLNVEYGYILPVLEKKTNAEIITININDIISMNDHYFRKVNQDDKSIYKDYKLPRSVCIHSYNGYRIIDGYNRYSAAIQNNINPIQVFLLS